MVRDLWSGCVDSVCTSARLFSHEAATAEFTHNPDAQVPDVAMREALMEAVGEGKTHFVDAT